MGQEAGRQGIMGGEGGEVSYWLYYSKASVDPKIGLAEPGLDHKIKMLMAFTFHFHLKCEY